MFPAEKPGEYEPHKIREKRQEVKVSSSGGNNGVDTPKADVDMKDADLAAPAEGATKRGPDANPDKKPEGTNTENAEGTEGQQGDGEQPKQIGRAHV